MTEVDQIIIGDEPALTETGPLAPEPDARPVAQIGDIFAIGKHRIICGDSTDPRSLEALMSDDKARLILTDQPYNVSIADHVTSGDHREFLTASGEMSDVEFRAFNAAWIAASLRHLCDGGLFGTFIDWRGYPAVHAAALQFGLVPFNLVVWATTNAGMGSLYRSQHELLPLFKHGNAFLNCVVRPPIRASNVLRYSLMLPVGPASRRSSPQGKRPTSSPPHRAVTARGLH